MMTEHELMLKPDVTGEVVGECSCGWWDDSFDTEAEAVDAWEHHCDVVFMELTTRG